MATFNGDNKLKRIFCIGIKDLLICFHSVAMMADLMKKKDALNKKFFATGLKKKKLTDKKDALIAKMFKYESEHPAPKNGFTPKQLATHKKKMDDMNAKIDLYDRQIHELNLEMHDYRSQVLSITKELLNN